MSVIERAAELLFFGDRVAHNVRFLCGGDENVRAENLAQQILVSETQIRAGGAHLVMDVDAHLTAISS